MSDLSVQLDWFWEEFAESCSGWNKAKYKVFVPSPISNNVSIFSEASLSAAEKAKRPTRIVWRRLSVSTMHWEPVMELTELTETVRI